MTGYVTFGGASEFQNEPTIWNLQDTAQVRFGVLPLFNGEFALWSQGTTPPSAGSSGGPATGTKKRPEQPPRHFILPPREITQTVKNQQTLALMALLAVSFADE